MNKKIATLRQRLAASDAQVQGFRYTCDSLWRELERVRSELYQCERVRAYETARLQAQINNLLDPIVRAKMLEPPPPIIIQGPIHLDK